MMKMRRIYKRSVLESRYALSFALSASVATTLTLFLILLDWSWYVPPVLFAASLLGVFYSKFGKPFEMSTDAGEVIPLLVLNLSILIVFVLLIK